jgi:hypothetical protein
MHQPTARARPGTPVTPVTPHTSTTPSIPQHRVQGDKKDGNKVNIKRQKSTQASRLACLPAAVFAQSPPTFFNPIHPHSLFASGWLPTVPGHSRVFGSASRPTRAPRAGLKVGLPSCLFPAQTNLLVLPGAEPDQPASTPTLMASHLSQNTTTC